MCLERFPGLWKPVKEAPRLGFLPRILQCPTPFLPEDIPWDVSVYFWCRKRTGEATAAAPFRLPCRPLGFAAVNLPQCTRWGRPVGNFINSCFPVLDRPQPLFLCGRWGKGKPQNDFVKSDGEELILHWEAGNGQGGFITIAKPEG